MSQQDPQRENGGILVPWASQTTTGTQCTNSPQPGSSDQKTYPVWGWKQQMLAEIEEHLRKSFCCGITLKNELWVRARLQCERGESCLPTAHLYYCLNWHRFVQMSKFRFSWSEQADQWLLDKKSWVIGVEHGLLWTWANSSCELPTMGDNQCTSGPGAPHPAQLHPLTLTQEELGAPEGSRTCWEPQSP